MLKSIFGEIGDDVFALLVDESSDISRKEQMAMVLRFVDKYGKVQERFVGVVHVMDTSTLSLKSFVDAFFAQHGLSLTQVLEYVQEDGDNAATRLQASGILSYFKTFEFVFYMHLMLTIFGLTNSLSQALQRKDQDILEAVSLIQTTKAQLQMLRENGFDQLVEKCYSLCDKQNVAKLDMAEGYVNPRNPRKRMNISNRHYYNYDIFNTVLDMQIREFGDRFCEVSTDLLQNMAALNPHNSFSEFNKESLLKLSEMYPRDFDDKERILSTNLRSTITRCTTMPDLPTYMELPILLY
ncbi:hypothetical protein OSB04_010967 [Centaurea solstitialis]|uniref:DUF4371 domain-containing protein n=1 Tax=Centaurea solstitialis TaxID=347529 RepID=A0AA38TG43_9ASTR|nr:hypothetical protein OSB04_010967 [Centaurea solstitialis]